MQINHSHRSYFTQHIQNRIISTNCKYKKFLRHLTVFFFFFFNMMCSKSGMSLAQLVSIQTHDIHSV